MILRVWSDLLTFKTVEFTDGMNIILSDRAEDSDDTESTNGLGKTTLLRIIHFCLGSDFSREKILNHPDLHNVTFGMDFTHEGTLQTVSRNTASHKVVAVSDSFIEGLEIGGELSGASLVQISVEDWRRALSVRLFPDTRSDQDSLKFSPTFRDLILYLIRVGKAGYVDPQMTFQGQSGASKRLCMSYLLGLSWALQRETQTQLANRRQVQEALKAIKAAEEATEERTIGDLEAERVALEVQLRTKRQEVETFNVRGDYRDLEKSLNDADRRIHNAP